MPDFAAVLKDGVSAARQKREPTKLECGLLGAAACIDRPGVNVRAVYSVVHPHIVDPLIKSRRSRFAAGIVPILQSRNRY
jgi:hypothetical protein